MENYLTIEEWVSENLLDDNGKLNRKVYFSLSPERIEQIEKATSILDSFKNVTMIDRIKYIIFQPKELYCPVCGKPRTFCRSWGKVFFGSCGDPKHNIVDRNLSKKRFKETIQLREKNLKELAEKTVYTREEIKLYIENKIRTNTKPNYFFASKSGPDALISAFVKQEAKKQGMRLNEFAYLVVHGEDSNKCSSCGAKTSFLGFDKGFSEHCGTCFQHKVGPIKENNKINNIKEYFYANGFDKNYQIIESPPINQDAWTIKHNNCGKEFNVFLHNGKWQSIFASSSFDTLCPHCFGEPSSSKMELELIDLIRKRGFDGKIERRKRFYPDPNKNKRHYIETDLFFPEQSIAIEMNGTYWHSSLDYKGSKYKHQKKQRILKDKYGITLIQFTDLDFKYKKDIVESMVMNKLGMNAIKIGARKTIIDYSISSSEYRDFLETNHIKGYCAAKYKIGLRDKCTNELLSIIGISSNRFGKKTRDNYEVIRFCSKLHLNVVGGLSKLMKSAVSLIEKEIGKKIEIETFVDLHYSSGKGYQKSGFVFIGETQPNYFYFNQKTDTLESRLKYQKHRLGLKKDSTMTEADYCLSIGLPRYYDCGNAKYKFSIGV